MQFFEGGGSVVSWVTVPEHLCGWKNIVHGGILATIFDEVMGRVILHQLKCFPMTKSMDIRFMKPASTGGELRAEGRVAGVAGEREATVEAFIYNSAGELCAHCTGIFAVIKPEAGRKLGLTDEEFLRWFEDYIRA
jgi:uncharacterized protein (TIGR00369 family)